MTGLNYNALIKTGLQKSTLYEKDKTYMQWAREESLFSYGAIPPNNVLNILKSPFYTHSGDNPGKNHQQVLKKALGIRTR